MKAADFGLYLQSKFYPHIAAENMFGTKVSFLKSFTRSDLAVKGWSNLITTVNNPLATSKLELTRDSTLVVIRDWSKKLREELTEEETAKYTNQAYRDHLNLKKKNLANMSGKSSKYDGLLDAAQARKPDYSKMQGRPEVGVSIQVGISQSDAPVEDPSLVNEDVSDNMYGGGIHIEGPFDDEPY